MILCAAIKFHIDKTDKDVVIPCCRHGDAYKILKDLGFEAKEGYKEIEQGFITTSNTFLNRKEAYRLAILYGQISPISMFNINSEELYSEDIY